MKIYIIGPVGSGKTTFAKKLSKKYHVKHYELDSIVWDDCVGKKFPLSERDSQFQIILKKKNWIIEDVGRECFYDGIILADLVYYIDCSFFSLFSSCTLRFFKQLFGFEKVNYSVHISILFQMYKWIYKDWKNKKKKLLFIKQNAKNYQIISFYDVRRNIL